MTTNVFKNNRAQFGGGGVYFNNKLLVESPNKYNIFESNKADFADDFFTLPIRIRFNGNKTSIDNVVPGVTSIQLNFEIIDYYNQTIRSLNGRFLINLKINIHYD